MSVIVSDQHVRAVVLVDIRIDNFRYCTNAKACYGADRNDTGGVRAAPSLVHYGARRESWMRTHIRSATWRRSLVLPDLLRNFPCRCVARRIAFSHCVTPYQSRGGEAPVGVGSTDGRRCLGFLLGRSQQFVLDEQVVYRFAHIRLLWYARA